MLVRTCKINSVKICNNHALTIFLMTKYMCMYIGQRRSVQIQNKMKVVELFNEMKRLQEERQLLIKEMKNYIHFYCDVMLPSLSKDIGGMHHTCTS